MNHELERCLERHPEAVLCAGFVVAAVASYDNKTDEVGYHVAKMGLEHGGMLGYMSSELFTGHGRACRKVKELGRVTLRNDLARAKKKNLLLKTKVEYSDDDLYVERDRLELQQIEELLNRLEVELVKLEN